MTTKKKILAIIGSTRADSSNLRLVKKLEEMATENFEVAYFNGLSELPHFNPDLDNENPPTQIVELRQQILAADGILICTPEYVFSIPGSLKNALEWCVSTTIFAQKPVSLITASASGEKGHEELILIMKTLEAKFPQETTLLIQGIKGKFNTDGLLTDEKTIENMKQLITEFDKQLNQ